MRTGKSDYKIIRVRPTLTEDSAYTAGDVIFNTTEIPNAVIGNGGCSKLLACFVIDENEQADDFELHFMQVNTAFATAGMHNTADITDDNLEAAKILGVALVDISEGVTTELDNARIIRAQLTNQVGGGESSTPFLIQAEDNSTSVYFTAIHKGTPTYDDTDSLEFIFHIER